METEQLPPTATEPADFASASPPSLAPEPTAEAAPQETDAAPSPEDGATPTEGSTEEAPQEAPPAPAWATVHSVDEVLEHEAIAPTVLERIEEAKKEGNSQAHSRLQPYLNRLGDKLKAVDEQLPAFTNGWSTIVEQAEAGNLDSKTLRQFSSDPANKHMFEALSGVHQELGTERGATEFIQGIANALKSQDFLNNFHPRVRQMIRDSFDPRQTGNMDPMIFDDLVTDIGSEVAKPLKAQIKELKATVDRIEGEKRDIQRTNNKPPADVGSASGAPGSESFEQLEHLYATGEATQAQQEEYIVQRVKRGLE